MTAKLVSTSLSSGSSSSIRAVSDGEQPCAASASAAPLLEQAARGRARRRRAAARARTGRDQADVGHRA